MPVSREWMTLRRRRVRARRVWARWSRPRISRKPSIPASRAMSNFSREADCSGRISSSRWTNSVTNVGGRLRGPLSRAFADRERLPAIGGTPLHHGNQTPYPVFYPSSRGGSIATSPGRRRLSIFTIPKGAIMTATTTRRAFLQATVLACTGAGLARAIDPIRRTGKARLDLSLAAYSFDRELSFKRKTKPTMTLEEFIDLGAKLELPAVELTAYYFPKTSPEYLKAIKSRCDKLGLAVSGTAVGNDF